MKMSTRGRYGLRAMLGLARHDADGPMLMQSLAKQEGLSIKYLHALLTKLKAAGLVRSVRGAGGGFILARPPAKIALNEILHALEGSLSLVPCVADKRTCRRANRCTVSRVWRELSDRFEDMLARVSLQDLLDSENHPGPGRSKKSAGQLRRKGGRVKPACMSLSDRRRLKGGRRITK